MFYFLVSNLVKGDTEMRLRTIYIIGSICYIILHAFLYRKQSPEYLIKYRHYMYYLCIVDIILTGTYMYITRPSNQKVIEHEPIVNNVDTIQPARMTNNKPDLSNKPEELQEITKPEITKPEISNQSDEGTFIPLYDN